MMDAPCNCAPFNWHKESRCVVPHLTDESDSLKLVPRKGGIFKERIICLACKQSTKWTWEKEN